MVNFLLLIEGITNYSKKDIDEGNTPSEIYELCKSVRECFCISYSIRKNNNLFFFFQNENILVKFEGNQLRYLGSDERSQALLLKKALDKKYISNLKYDSWIKSTPGIYFQKFSEQYSIISYLNSMKKEKFIFILDEEVINNDFMSELKNFITLENISEHFYIIPTYSISKTDTNLLEGLKNIQFVQLFKIYTTQDKILYINYQIDKSNGL